MRDNAGTVFGNTNDQQKADEAHIKNLHAKFVNPEGLALMLLLDELHLRHSVKGSRCCVMIWTTMAYTSIASAYSA